MNAVTVVLIALAVHFGGVDVDTGGAVTLQWFENSYLQSSWELSGQERGFYTFTNGGDTLLVERLLEPDMAYAISRRDIGGTVTMISAVSLDGATEGRRVAITGELSVDPENVLVAITLGDTGSVLETPASEDGAFTGVGVARDDSPATDSAPAVGTTSAAEAASTDGAVGARSYQLLRADGLITVSDRTTQQLLVLRF